MPQFQNSGVSIAIPSHNGRELLEECLPSIVEAVKYHGHADDEICITDDGSSDGSFEFLREHYPQINVVRNEKATGFSRACNTAIALCKNEIVILLNNDVKVEKDFITPIMPHFNDPKVFGVTLRALAFDKKKFRSGGQVGRFKRGYIRAWENYDVENPKEHKLAKNRQLDSLYGIGAHVAYRMTMFRDLGELDPIYSPYIWEDTDICYRAWKRGWVTRYEPTSQVYHKWNVTISKLSPGSKQVILSSRNRLIFHWKNIGDLDMLVLHFVMLFLRGIPALLTLRKSFLLPLWQAVRMLPEILEKRSADKGHWVRSDREILEGTLKVIKETGVISHEDIH